RRRTWDARRSWRRKSEGEERSEKAEGDRRTLIFYLLPFPFYLHMNNIQSILGSIGASDFLRDHWQKKPLLIRQALPGFESPIDADELAGLACEDSVESRLIEKRGDRYALEHGPFDAARFAKLAKRDWTLLVQ